MSAEAPEVFLNSEENPLNPERVRAEDHIRLAHHVLHRVHHRFDDDDLSAAVLVLVEAARDWNSDRRPEGVGWPTYAANRIRWSRLATWRTGAAKARRLEIPLFLTMPDDDAAELERPEMARDDPEPTRAEARADVARLLATLPRKQADVLRRRYGIGAAEEATAEAVGKDLGVGRQRVHQLEQKALRTLRRRAAGRRMLP